MTKTIFILVHHKIQEKMLLGIIFFQNFQNLSYHCLTDYCHKPSDQTKQWAATILCHNNNSIVNLPVGCTVFHQADLFLHTVQQNQQVLFSISILLPQKHLHQCCNTCTNISSSCTPFTTSLNNLSQAQDQSIQVCLYKQSSSITRVGWGD